MPRILCLNSGSSSLKFAVWDLAAGETLRLADEVHDAGIRTAVRQIWQVVLERALLPIDAIGYRVVFGGPRHAGPARIDAALLDELRALSRFAPLHMPPGLAAIDELMRLAPSARHVACFDTAYHRRMPGVAQRLPLPQAVVADGLCRFGFHGLSYEYVLSSVAEARKGRAILAHLGHGASLSAVRDGRPVDTSMGFSPSGGLTMSTRTGDLDPAVLIHLVRDQGWDADRLERLTTRESGLKGVSGTTGDMRTLLERRASDPRAAEAVELFCYDAAKHIGAMAAALDGVDVLVFTGGIGEHAAPVRWEICTRLGHLGVRIDRGRNDRHEAIISDAGAACLVRIVQTDENLMIARHTRDLVTA